MAKYTREQINRWNAKCANGFEMDLNRLLMWNEKQARKRIRLADGRVLTATIGWYDVRDGFRYTGLVRPKINLQVWKEDGQFMTSSGMGATIKFTEQTFTKRAWNELCKFTAEWDEKRIMQEMQNNMDQLHNPFLY